LKGVECERGSGVWTTEYQFATKENITYWDIYSERFIANKDYDSIVKRTMLPLVSGKTFRIYPLAAHGRYGLRFELYGCPACGENLL